MMINKKVIISRNRHTFRMSCNILKGMRPLKTQLHHINATSKRKMNNLNVFFLICHTAANKILITSGKRRKMENMNEFQYKNYVNLCILDTSFLSLKIGNLEKKKGFILIKFFANMSFLAICIMI